jgi:hypothetical protein
MAGITSTLLAYIILVHAVRLCVAKLDFIFTSPTLGETVTTDANFTITWALSGNYTLQDAEDVVLIVLNSSAGESTAGELPRPARGCW